MLFQVKWFSKKKGYGFVEDETHTEFFVHHSDIKLDSGFRYLKQGEYITGEKEEMEGNKVKISNIKAPMNGGQLMCQVEKTNRENKTRVQSEE
tara:strand:+ start:212 stop:490 length:279 start_codon:yes stop_codon:yes gene_type:complete